MVILFHVKFFCVPASSGFALRSRYGGDDDPPGTIGCPGVFGVGRMTTTGGEDPMPIYGGPCRD